MQVVPALRVLRLEILSDEVHLSLAQQGAYPPSVADRENPAAPRSARMQARVALPAGALEAAAEGDPGALQALGTRLAQGQGQALWRALGDGLAAPDSDRGPDDSPWVKGRLEILGGPAAWAVPWGALPWPEGEGPLSDRLAVLVRDPSPWAPNDDLSLPMLLGVSWTGTGPPRPPGQLIDPFAQQAIALQVLRLLDDPAITVPVAVRHLSVDSRQGLPPAAALAHARVVVIEELGPPRGVALAALAREILGAGAAAVLYMALGEGATGAAADVLRLFYRALMHDSPVDMALAAALAIDHRIHAMEQPAGARLWCRARGELSIQLAGLALDRLQAVRTPTRDLDFLGWEPVDGPRSTPTTADAPKPRVERLKESLRGPLLKASELLRGGYRVLAVRLDQAPRDQEARYLDAICDVRREVDAASEKARVYDHIADTLDVVASEPPTRVLRAWLASSKTDGPEDAPLAAATLDQPAFLHVNIGEEVACLLASAPLDEEKLRQFFQTHERATLTVALYAGASDLTVERRHLPITLPRVGPSTIACFQITPRVARTLHLRVCLFHHNALLQSMSISLPVLDALGRPADGAARATFAAEADWDARPDLALLDEIDQTPRVTLWANESPDGTHQIGAWQTAEDASAEPIQRLWDFDGDDFNALAMRLRETLLDVEGETYSVWAGSVPEVRAGAGTLWRQRQRSLVKLACEGRRAWNALFELQCPVEDDADGGVPAWREAFNRSVRLTIARCRPKAGSIPWAALYRYYLDPEKETEIGVCPVFVAQMEQNEWREGKIKQTYDLLDDPVACAAQGSCPLRDEARRAHVVCPFGFLGFSHQIEQPLKNRAPADIPRPTADPEILIPTPLPITMAVWPKFGDVEVHRQEILDLRKDGISIEKCVDRDEVVLALSPPAAKLIYFYCHCGEEKGDVFLRLGRNAAGATDVAPGSFNVEKRWVGAPLVFVNACESVETSPQRFGSFLNAFRALGASGVIGTEIKVWTTLARKVALLVLDGLLRGESLGLSFLNMRRQMLRELNPLGLAYTYYAEAGLRLVPIQLDTKSKEP